MQQEKISFFTADDFPVYEGHPITLWVDVIGKATPFKSDSTEFNKNFAFFLESECTKFDITKCTTGDFLKWARDLELETSTGKLKLNKDSKVLFVGAEQNYFVVVDVESKKNLNLSRSDARINLLTNG